MTGLNIFSGSPDASSISANPPFLCATLSNFAIRHKQAFCRQRSNVFVAFWQGRFWCEAVAVRERSLYEVIVSLV